MKSSDNHGKVKCPSSSVNILSVPIIQIQIQTSRVGWYLTARIHNNIIFHSASDTQLLCWCCGDRTWLGLGWGCSHACWADIMWEYGAVVQFKSSILSFLFQTSEISPFGCVSGVMTKIYTPMMMNDRRSVIQIVSHNNGTTVDSRQSLMEVPANVNKSISDNSDCCSWHH